MLMLVICRFVRRCCRSRWCRRQVMMSPITLMIHNLQTTHGRSLHDLKRSWETRLNHKQMAPFSPYINLSVDKSAAVCKGNISIKTKVSPSRLHHLQTGSGSKQTHGRKRVRNCPLKLHKLLWLVESLERQDLIGGVRSSRKQILLNLQFISQHPYC